MIIKQESKNCIVFLLAFFYTDLGDLTVIKNNSGIGQGKILCMGNKIKSDNIKIKKSNLDISGV